MGTVLWLASYPKSGNTWLRTFLHNFLLQTKTPAKPNELTTLTLGEADRHWYDLAAGTSTAGWSSAELSKLRLQAQQLMANSRQGTVFAKTHAAIAQFHHYPTLNMQVSAGAIYVVRDPRDVVISGAHHFGIGIDERIERINDENNCITDEVKVVTTFMSSWSNHVKSWTAKPNPAILILRYEDMEQKPLETFGRLAQFLKVKHNKAQLEKAIRFSSFDTMRSLEEQHGFSERTVHADRFFRAGRSAQWKEILTKEQIARIESDHGEQMRRFGYV